MHLKPYWAGDGCTMSNHQQSTLGECYAQLSDESRIPIRSGIVQSIDWTRNAPRLYFADDAKPLGLGSLVGRTVNLSMTDEQVCTVCTESSTSSPCSECDGTPPRASCVYNPGVECTYSNCPFPEFKAESCSHDFVVYLAAKDRVKVGITRAGRRTKRWRGQGATHALVFARAPNRKLAGIIETICSEHLPDRVPSGWFTPMDEPRTALLHAAETCAGAIPDRLSSCVYDVGTTAAAGAERIVRLDYPEWNPESIDFGALESATGSGSWSGTLRAIRGSVLATDAFTFNVRKNRGRILSIEMEADA